VSELNFSAHSWQLKTEKLHGNFESRFEKLIVKPDIFLQFIISVVIAQDSNRTEKALETLSTNLSLQINLRDLRFKAAFVDVRQRGECL
jgi:hypothetical protein